MNSSYITAGLLIVIVGLGVYLFTGGSEIPTVSAVGEAHLTSLPDEVVVYVSVEARAVKAVDAQTTLHETSDGVATALRALGIQDSAIQQQTEQVYQDYSWETGRQMLRGFVASQTIVVRTTDVRSVANIVDAVVGAGGLIQGINFELSDAHSASLKAEALTAAGQDAEKKATALAAGVGKKLGSLVSVQNQDYNYGPIVYYARAESAGSGTADAKLAAASLTPRDVDVTASVAVTYRLARW